jgi:hypothetical protein
MASGSSMCADDCAGSPGSSHLRVLSTAVVSLRAGLYLGRRHVHAAYGARARYSPPTIHSSRQGFHARPSALPAIGGRPTLPLPCWRQRQLFLASSGQLPSTGVLGRHRQPSISRLRSGVESSALAPSKWPIGNPIAHASAAGTPAQTPLRNRGGLAVMTADGTEQSHYWRMPFCSFPSLHPRAIGELIRWPSLPFTVPPIGTSDDSFHLAPDDEVREDMQHVTNFFVRGPRSAT